MLTNTCTCSLTFVNLYRVRFFLVQNVARSIKWHLFTDLFFCQKFGVSTSPSCQKLMPVKSSKLFIFLPHLSHAIFSCSCLRICKKELKLTKFCSCVLKTSLNVCELNLNSLSMKRRPEISDIFRANYRNNSADWFWSCPCYLETYTVADIQYQQQYKFPSL